MKSPNVGLALLMTAQLCFVISFGQKFRTELVWRGFFCLFLKVKVHFFLFGVMLMVLERIVSKVCPKSLRGDH